MFELFMFGTFWFWILVALELVALFLFIENENGIGATISVLIFGAFLQFISGVDILGFVYEHPYKSLLLVAAYILIGISWSMFRFWWLVSNKVQEIIDQEKEFIHGFTPNSNVRYDENGVMTPEAVVEWNKYVDKHTPTAVENKSFICRLIAYWPINMVWFLISDFVKEFFIKIYNRISKVYDRIVESAKKKAKK